MTDLRKLYHQQSPSLSVSPAPAVEAIIGRARNRRRQKAAVAAATGVSLAAVASLVLLVRPGGPAASQKVTPGVAVTSSKLNMLQHANIALPAGSMDTSLLLTSMRAVYLPHAGDSRLLAGLGLGSRAVYLVQGAGQVVALTPPGHLTGQTETVAQVVDAQTGRSLLTDQVAALNQVQLLSLGTPFDVWKYCSAASLRASVTVHAGQLTLRLTNVSHRFCVLAGYPTHWTQQTADNPLTLKGIVDIEASDASVVSLDPGRAALLRVRLATSCEPARSGPLSVWLPGSGSALLLATSVSTSCQAQVSPFQRSPE